MKNVLLCVVMSGGLSGWALAQDHADLSPRVQAGQIVVDAHDDLSGTTFQNVRVFGYDFGEDADDPFFLGDPGFHAITGSGLPAGSRLGIQILDDLRYWDGDGGVVFGPPPDDESIKLQFGSQSRTAGEDTGPLSNLLFGPPVGAGGTFHEHLSSQLLGRDGNIEPASETPGWPLVGYAGDGIEAAAGIYLLQASLTSDAPGILSSNPIWILYNHGLDEQTHDEAIDWVSSNLVPEPASIGLIMLAGISCLRRRGSMA